MPTTIAGVEALDIRFPTSLGEHGSDAMHTDPDYSAAYVVLHTDRADGLAGHGLTFTLGRGNELCVAGIEALAPTGRRADARGDPRRHGRLLAPAHQRLAAALGRARRRA